MITRRDVFVALIAAGTTSAVLMTPWQVISNFISPPHASTGLGRPFDALLMALDGTHGVGKAFIESHTTTPETAALIAQLQARLGEALNNRKNLESRIGEIVRADFTAGRTCKVDGWLLSQTECELAGLRWQLYGEKSAQELLASKSNKNETIAPAISAAIPQIANVINWGPRSTEQGSKFNVQPDGHSGLWFQAADAPSWVKIRIDGVDAPTTVNESGITSGLFGQMQERILSTPGKYQIELYDPMNEILQPIGEFEVRAYAERAILADGSTSKVFCNVTNWGPDQATAGLASNPQPDGSEGFWFLLPCAPANVQLIFGDDRLPATRTDRGVTSRVPLAFLETPRDVPLKLRDVSTGEEISVGVFKILPP